LPSGWGVGLYFQSTVKKIANIEPGAGFESAVSFIPARGHNKLQPCGRNRTFVGLTS